MERFRCKLCFKQFGNGKALGGHMRSHLAVLPLPPKTPDSVDGGAGLSDSTLSLCCSSEEEKDGGGRGGSVGLGENPRKSFRRADPEIFEGESVGESTRNLTRRRSKRARRMFGDGEKGKGKAEESRRPETGTCSFSDEEEVARCLMMMSRDFRGSPEAERRRLGNLRCEICGRDFKSTQALGSHRTTHGGRGGLDGNPRNPAVKVDDAKMHECPFCERVFGSGQALGGHKRSHFFPSPTNKAAAAAAGAAGSVSVSGSDSGTVLGSGSCSSKIMIDLNMPAPMEDDDVSAVSFR
ncbi:hypothetical protein DM860_011763 [Cuscuta australis]|uniref:C2H2-type domain-containing protein n=1 Tax=Cuscuta australis TaxID=267555 RepID=A0A328DG59_9ASTE|nr:hypothetical protein DM860_011763 [Cuscuta australis]